MPRGALRLSRDRRHDSERRRDRCCLPAAIHPGARLDPPPRGDFVYSALELAAMHHDIEVAKTLGAAGVVVGVLTAQRAIDREQVALLAALARPLSLTFHKAFDQVRDQFAALDVLIELGIDRVLTSGGRLTALDGIANLAALVTKAHGRLAIMAGGRLDEGSLPRVIREGKVSEVHLGSAVSETAPAR